MEDNTLQSSLFGKPIEFYRNNSSHDRHMVIKNSELRLQNIGNNSGVSVNRIASRSYSSDYVINNGILRSSSADLISMSNSEVQEGETDQNGFMKTSIKKSGLNKVQEVSGEDECTPSPAGKQFFPTKPNHSFEIKALSLEEKEAKEQDLEKIKAEKRRLFEEEMLREMREMNHTSRDQIREDWEHEDDTHLDTDRKDYSAENIQLEEADDNKHEEVKIKPRAAPIQNPLFKRLATVEFQEEEDYDNEDDYVDSNEESSPIKTERTRNIDDEIEKRFAEIRPTTSEGLQKSWVINEEPNDKEINSGDKEINSGVIKTPSDKETENQVSVIGIHNDDIWTEDLEGPVAYPGNRNRLIRSDLDRLRRSKKKQLEQELNCEVVDIVAPPYKINLLEVTVNDSVIHQKESPASYNGEARPVETFPPKTFRSDGPFTPKEIINIGGEANQVFVQSKREAAGYKINIIS